MNAHACLVHPGKRGRYIGTAWGGLFISVWAFGDASDKINRTLSRAFFVEFFRPDGGHTRLRPDRET